MKHTQINIFCAETEKLGYGQQLLSTIVMQKFHVSTMYRQCSAAAYDGWYFETMVFTWSRETGNLDIVHTSEGGKDGHAMIVEKLLKGESLTETDDE